MLYLISNGLVMSKLPKSVFHRGQILLSLLIAIAVFAILAHALFTLIASSFDLVSLNKARITARHLAQEKIEIIRNISYSDIGTVGGIPNGIIEQQEIVRRNGLNYTVKTDISYVDDPFNGTGASDTDYKRVRIEVTWEGLAASRKNPIVILSDISSEALEEIAGGTLIILVYDASGNPVTQAQVTIVSSGITPAVNLTVDTDSNGRVVRSGATACIECYQITVTKEGFSLDRTYSTNEVANPIKPSMSVFLNSPTQSSFAIDRVGTLTISSFDSRENNFIALGNVSFRLHGNKIIGTDTLAQPVYKYDQNIATNATGMLNLPSMEWGVYQVFMPTLTSYDISGTFPILPLNLSPGVDFDFTFAVNSHTNHSLFFTLKDPSQNLIASASARLYDDSGFDQTKPTGISTDPDFGQALFSGLNEQTYHLTATASGFVNFNGDFDVSGYTKADLVLIPE